MHQIQQSYRTGELDVVDVPAPALRAGGLLVANAFSLISAGTERKTVSTAQQSLLGKAKSRPDLVRQVLRVARREGLLETYRMVKNRLETPLPLGYSCAGFVVAAADDVQGFRPGDPVACAGAGYASHAEVVSVPRNLVARVPQGVALEDAAYATVGAIALQGVRRAGVGLGDRVLVLGLGLIGQLTVRILRAAGCRVLAVDLAPDLVDLARAGGADLALARAEDVESAALRFGDGFGVDAAIVTASTKGNDPVELAGAVCRERGRVVIVGAVRLDVPREVFYRKELDLVLSRSYGPGRYDPAYEERGLDYPLPYVRWTEQRNLDAFLGLLAAGALDLKPLTTHRFDVTDAEAAYRVVTGETPGRSIGILLRYPRAQETAAEPPAPPLPKAGERPGVSFVGAGSFAQGFLLPHVAGASLRAVVATDGLRARAAQAKFGFAAAATDAEAAIADPGTHAVVIATRHDSHADLACRALRAGKYVFVEKPLALTCAQLEAVRAAAAPGRLMVGFNRRFAPAARAARAALATRQGPLLVHYRVNAAPLPRGHWLLDPAIGGGRLLGEACHFVDFVLFLTGERLVRVFAAGSTALALELSRGSAATIHYTDDGDRALPKEWIEVAGGGRVVQIDDFREVTLFAQGRRRRVPFRGKGRGHREEMEAFLGAVRAGGPLPGSAEDAFEVTEAMLLAEESLRTGECALLPRREEGGGRGT